jgi:signal transduction histidine kinase
VYERHIAEIIRNHYTMGGLRFTVEEAGRTHTFLVAFSGVVADGRLLRIWGVAREVTEMEQLNARLQREQDRLRTYARELANAEERARRATAVDLHDGIGQSLVGMAMTLNAVRGGVSAEVKPLIDEVQLRLRAVQDHTRNMISDLSPPGLYDLGLGPALQWLAVYARSRDRLNVQLTLEVEEERVPLEMRVLVFKLVRELLRNVARHSGVDTARLIVQDDARVLRVEVTDHGRGFEWNRDRRSDSFGLWSIADRVQEAGGSFSVDASPGAGARLLMEFPLRVDGADDAAGMAEAG